MLTPTLALLDNDFSPLDDTSAVSLTRAVPHGQNADILVLGGSSAHDTLFTAFMETNLRM